MVEGIGCGALVRTAEQIGKAHDDSPEDKLKAARQTLRRILKKAEPYRLRIMVDDAPLPEEQLMVEVLNIACAGPRLRLVPTADMGDGQLDVVVLEPGQREAMRDWLADDRPLGPPPLSRWRGRKVGIVWDGTPMHVDDDLPPPEGGPALVELALEGEPATLLVP